MGWTTALSVTWDLKVRAAVCIHLSRAEPFCTFFPPVILAVAIMCSCWAKDRVELLTDQVPSATSTAL